MFRCRPNALCISCEGALVSCMRWLGRVTRRAQSQGYKHVGSISVPQSIARHLRVHLWHLVAQDEIRREALAVRAPVALHVADCEDESTVAYPSNKMRRQYLITTARYHGTGGEELEHHVMALPGHIASKRGCTPSAKEWQGRTRRCPSAGELREYEERERGAMHRQRRHGSAS